MTKVTRSVVASVILMVLVLLSARLADAQAPASGAPQTQVDPAAPVLTDTEKQTLQNKVQALFFAQQNVKPKAIAAAVEDLVEQLFTERLAAVQKAATELETTYGSLQVRGDYVLDPTTLRYAKPAKGK